MGKKKDSQLKISKSKTGKLKKRISIATPSCPLKKDFRIPTLPFEEETNVFKSYLHLKNEGFYWQDFNSENIYQLLQTENENSDKGIYNFCIFLKEGYTEIIKSEQNNKFLFENIRTFNLDISSKNLHKICVLQDNDNIIKFFNIETEETSYFKGHLEEVILSCLSNDGKLLISMSADINILIWDVETKKILHSFFLQGEFANSICISNENEKFALATDSEKLIIFSGKFPFDKLFEINTSNQIKKFSINFHNNFLKI